MKVSYENYLLWYFYPKALKGLLSQTSEMMIDARSPL